LGHLLPFKKFILHYSFNAERQAGAFLKAGLGTHLFVCYSYYFC